MRKGKDLEGGADQTDKVWRPVKVGVKAGRVINLGNYESARVEAWVEFDTLPGQTEEDGYQEAWRIVEDQIRQEKAKFKV